MAGFGGYGANTTVAASDALLLEQGGNTRFSSVSQLTEAINLRVNLSGVGTTATPTQTLVNAIYTTLEFRTEAQDDAYATDLSLAPGIPLRVDATTAGYWLVYCSVEFAYHANNTTPRRVKILDGAGSIVSLIEQRATSASVVTNLAAHGDVKLEAHDFIRVQAQQEAGAGETVAVNNAFFYAHRMAFL